MNIDTNTAIGDILDAFPGARRALFSRYHLGGCQSCGFSPSESIESLCLRNGGIDPEEMITHLRQAHEHDQLLLVAPTAVKELLESENPPILLDCRTREEHEAVSITGAKFLTQELQQQLFATAPDQEIILYDHQGKHALDTCAWFLGHGMKNTRVMHGGIDAWSRDIDPTLPRYQLEIES